MNITRANIKVRDDSSVKFENKLTRPSFMSLFWQRLDKNTARMANNCSFHGWNWYLKVSNTWEKILVFLIMIVFCNWVMYGCLVRICDLYNSLNNVSASEKENSFKERPYPRLTLCHPSFFNRNLLKGKKIPTFAILYLLTRECEYSFREKHHHRNGILPDYHV